MTTQAPTPEEIARDILDKQDLPSWEIAQLESAISDVLRTYGDRRYCEARDAAARLVETWEDDMPDAVAEAIRKLTP